MTQTLKILILEDEEPAAERLIQLIHAVQPGLSIEGPLDTVKDAVNHLSHEKGYDLIFADIQLADGKSFSIFEQLNITIPVIFTTAYDEFALKAFEMNSIDYLLKPVKKELLEKAFRKFQNMKEYYEAGNMELRMQQMLQFLRAESAPVFKDRFLISRGDALIPVKAREIACFFAGDREVMLMTFDGNKYFVPHSIEELVSLLNPRHFFRVNRQFIIAADAIQRVQNYFNFKLKIQLKVDPGQEIIVSRSRTVVFKAWMNDE